MRKAWTSKINLKEVLTIGVGIAALWGLIPPEYEVKVLQTAVFLSPVMGLIFSTFFNETVFTWADTEAVVAEAGVKPLPPLEEDVIVPDDRTVTNEGTTF